MYVAATLRATLAASAVLAALGGCSRAFEEDVRDARELPPDLRVLRVHIPLGTLSVESGEPGRLTFEGRSRRVAATQADLERLREVDFRPVLSPTDEPGVYEYAAPDPPETLDEADQAAMVLKGVLRLPPDVAVDVRTFRGPLSVVDRRADVRLWTASGDLRVDGVTGDVAATTHRGNVILRGIRGSVAVETDDGAILAFIDEIGPGGLQLDSEQPAITLQVPPGAGFVLDARVDRAESADKAIRTGYDVPVTAEGDGYRARAVVGSGGPEVALRVGRGRLSVSPRD